MTCITYKSKAIKTFPMETPSNRKVLSECSNMQTNLHLGLENCIDSTKKADSCLVSCSSNALTVDMSAMCSNAGSHLVEDHPTTMGDTDYLTPNKNGFDSTYGISSSYASPPVDFSALTAADFGITPESFTKQYKGNSNLLKFRRRSTIGVRGSPENNSLIQYIAHQKRIKKQVTMASPLQCRNTWLKDKIAAFQFSFKPLEETKESAIHIAGSSMKTDRSLHEQSKVGLSECKDFEENRHWKSVSRGRTSADIQGDSVSSLQKHLIINTTAVSKVIPVLQADSRESGCIHLEATTDKSVCELSSNATSDQSCKKVRFAEKLSLEIFDGNKPPITPIRKEQLPSNSLHSALKKTPVTMFTEDMKGHLEKRTEEESEVLPDCKNFETLLIDPPLRRRREAMFNASGSRERSSIRSPDKQPLSQPNFDYVDELPQQAPDVSTSEYAVNSDLEETKNSSPAFQAASTRITRSSAKKKSINKAEEMALNPTKKTLPKSIKFQKAEAATKSTEKRTAVRSKVFGKQRRRKKKQKVMYGERQTASKKPVLSPIPEMTEDLSSYQSSPKSEVSIFDDSSSSVLNTESMHENQPNIQHSSRKDSSCLHSILSLVTEDALPDNVSGSSSQLLDMATNDMKDTLPWNPLEKSSPEKSKSCYFPSVEDFESKAPESNPSVPRDNMNKLPPWTVNDSELLDNLQSSIEESFRSVTRSNKKRVRRSMRLLKDVENDGLAWIQMPDDNVLGQAILGSAVKGQNRKSTSRCPEVEPLHSKQGTRDQMLLPMKEGQKKTHVATGPTESRRKGISVLSLEENKNATLHNQRNRRSLGYKSDRCYQKDLINQKIIWESN